MDIDFYPDSYTGPLVTAAKEYQEIWNKEKDSILGAFKKLTGLSFVEKKIIGVVFEGVSYSNPLCLRASYSSEVKKATIIHELAHRLMLGNGIAVKGASECHKQINLVLYDMWADLYGKKFANMMVGIESTRAQLYKDAWEWSLSFDREKRIFEFKRLATKKER